MLFNHKRADFWLPNIGFKRSFLRFNVRWSFVTMATNLSSYFYSIFKNTPEVSSKFFFVEIC